MNLSQGTQFDLKQTDWVLRFYDTHVKNDHAWWDLSFLWEGVSWKSQQVSDVAILQLTYLKDGEVYSMGVVDDYDSPDDKPDGFSDTYFDDFVEEVKETLSDLWDKIGVILKVIIVVLLLVVCAPMLPLLINVIAFILKWAFKIAWWLFLFPWNLIGKLFKKKNKKNDDKK